MKIQQTVSLQIYKILYSFVESKPRKLGVIKPTNHIMCWETNIASCHI